jgi:hypothetical protein
MKHTYFLFIVCTLASAITAHASPVLKCKTVNAALDSVTVASAGNGRLSAIEHTLIALEKRF